MRAEGRKHAAVTSKTNAHPSLPLVPSLKEESGLLDSTPYTLPSLTSYCQPPHIANSLAILPYFRAIQPLVDNKADMDEIIEQLSKLNIPHEPETEVSVPENTFEHKRFISAVVQKFSTCMDSIQS